MSQKRSNRFIPAWAIGETRTKSDRERKLTAAVYVQIPGVLDHVQREGRLPPTLKTGGAEIGLRIVIQRRGIDLELNEEERLVFDALGAEEDAPAGWAVLIPVDSDGRPDLPPASRARPSSRTRARTTH